MYKCKQCQLAVVMCDGKIIRACKCNAGVIVDMRADTKGSAAIAFKNKSKENSSGGSK